jgi:hypothetical protein
MYFMKFGIALAIVALSGSITLTAAAQTTGTTKDEKTQVSALQAKDTYSCPMHPEVTGDKTGKCPKCGMALVKNDTGTDSKQGKKHMDGKCCAENNCTGKTCEGKSKEGCGRHCNKDETHATGKH